MESSKKRLVIVLGGLALAAVLLLLHDNYTRMKLLPIRHHLSTSTSPVTAANATLGFGAVIAVSRAASPRREGLLYAANLTGIDVVIPEQPIWTDEDVEAFRNKEKSHITKGSVLAWMGHLNTLRWFLSTSLETALILEDDVDWDIRLRTTQIPLVATAARHLISNKPPRLAHDFNSTTQFTSLPDNPFHNSEEVGGSQYYWPHPSKWSILYLGHCSDPTPTPLSASTSLAFHDPTLDHFTLHPSTSAHLSSLRLPTSTRLLHKSHSPLCTFAYAVTRASAQKILDDYGSEGEGGCDAFNVRILEACRDHGFVEWEKGREDGYKCYSVSLELFHHLEGGSEIRGVDVGASRSFGREEERRKEEEGVERTKSKSKRDNGTSGGVKGGIGSTKPTRNIPCRARHPGFYVDVKEEGGVEAADWLKDVVGRQGNCLVDWAEEDMGLLE